MTNRKFNLITDLLTQAQNGLEEAAQALGELAKLATKLEQKNTENNAED